MHRPRSPRPEAATILRSVLAAAAVLLLVLPARAQEAAAPAGFRTIGYVVNAPKQLAGLHFASVEPGGLGWFGDLKLTVFIEPDESILYDVPQGAVERTGDPFDRERRVRNSLNGGVTFRLSRRAFVYAGVGAQQKTDYLRYENTSGLVGGRADHYWITDEGFGVNALGGLGFRVHRYVTAIVGVEASPRGVTAGLGYTIPARSPQRR